MQQKRYEFVPGDEIVIAPGRSLKRIRALVAIANLAVSPGDLGGYIEHEGNLTQSDQAWVSGNAKVFGNAKVSGDAEVFGNAKVSGQSDWLIVGPAKSSGRFTTAFRDEELDVRVVCGCFSGSVLEFSQQIEATHANNTECLQQYRLFCQLIAFNFSVESN